MAAINEVTISNSALDHLGEDPITSLSQDNPAGRACGLSYPVALDLVISMHPWRSFTKRQVLAPLTSTPEFQYDLEYILPSDMVMFRSLHHEGGQTIIEKDRYKVEGNFVRTNENPIYLIYSQRPDASRLSVADPQFAEAVALYMAWRMCYKLTQSRTLKFDLEQAIRETTFPSKNSRLSRRHPEGA